MREIMEQLQKIVAGRFASAASCHDLDHTMRVTANALMLCRDLPEADACIVHMAALLHDVARGEEDRRRGEVDHAVLGAAMVPEILRAFDLPGDTVAKVAAAVRTHRYRNSDRPESLEAKIVFDADKLDSLGAVGIGRAFLFAGHANARLHNDEKTALAASSYSREDTAYREYLVKLRKLPDTMLTCPGRAMARERAAFMDVFFERLNQETCLKYQN